MQQVTGRLTADAVVATTNSGKEVVNFRIADNETYKKKGETEPVTITTYFNCAYWLSTAVAKVLRKGAVVQLNGRVSARPYQTNTGNSAAALEFNASRISVLAYPAKDGKPSTTTPKANTGSKGKGNDNGTGDDDLPF